MKHSHFELAKAVYCENCRCISDSRGSCCCCGSHSLLNMARIMSESVPETTKYETEQALYRLEVSQ